MSGELSTILTVSPEPAVPTAAVVIATRDRAPQLRLALEGVSAAAPPGTAVVVVDSAGDTDEARSVASGAGAVYVRADEPGVSLARNLGAAAVEVEVVVFTDDDCRPRPGWFEAIVAPFADDAVGFVTGRVEGLGEGSAADVGDLGPARWSWPDDPAGMGSGANMAVRRRALLDCGGFDRAFGGGGTVPAGEEQELFLRLLHGGWEGRHAPASVVDHHDLRDRWATIRLFYAYGVGSGAICVRARRLDAGVGRRMLRRRLWTNGVRAVAADLRRGWEVPAIRGAAMTLGVIVGWARSLAPTPDQRPASTSSKR